MNERFEIDVPEFVPIAAAVLVVWWTCAIGAAICAPKGRSVQFAIVTLLFLGPLGVGFAAAAARPRELRAPHGRHTVRCPRCDARQHVLTEDTNFECWRCFDRYMLERGPFGRKLEVGRLSVGSGPRTPAMGPGWQPHLVETSWRGRGEWVDTETA